MHVLSAATPQPSFPNSAVRKRAQYFQKVFDRHRRSAFARSSETQTGGGPTFLPVTERTPVKQPAALPQACVLEGGRRMAGRAVRAELAAMHVVDSVACNARPRQLGSARHRAGMAAFALQAVMRACQCKFGLAIVVE